MNAADMEQVNLNIPQSDPEPPKSKLSDGELPVSIEAPIEMTEIIARKRSIFTDLTIVEVILGHRAYFFASIRDRENLWVQIRAMVMSCFVFYGIYCAVIGASPN